VRRTAFGALVALFVATALLPGIAWSQTSATTAVATFGSGCFWCTESDFDKVPGVVATTSGYMGGTTANPTYAEVTTGRTGHYEVVQVTYDPSKVTYEKLLDTYWHNVDPFDARGQFCDKGTQYRPVIFTHSDEQKRLAEESKVAVAKELGQRFKFPIMVEIADAKPFTAAEEYHQDFYKKNPQHYERYRIGCGRDARLKTIWGAKETN
jgi:peptide-methionine (S)-S-oxide reductase